MVHKDTSEYIIVLRIYQELNIIIFTLGAIVSGQVKLQVLLSQKMALVMCISMIYVEWNGVVLIYGMVVTLLS